MTSVRRREAALKKTVRDITRISCFVTTMKLLHVLQIFYSSFCVEVYVVARFKVRQQQTIGEVANSIMCLRENYFVCNSERIIKIRHYLLKLCSYEERSSFFDLQCIYNLHWSKQCTAKHPATNAFYIQSPDGIISLMAFFGTAILILPQFSQKIDSNH